MDKAHIKYTLSWATLVLMIFVFIYVTTIFDVIGQYGMTTIVLIGINLIAAVGLNLVIGMSGQFSLGHAGFMAIGAYATALVSSAIPSIYGFIISLIVGIMVSGVIALAVGLPTLRLSGDYLAIATLGVAEIIRIIIINMKSTRGAAGIFGIPNFVNWQVVFGLSVVAIVFVVNFVRSTTGQAIIAVRDNEIAAESLGINTTKYKVIAFVLGAMLAAVAGGLRASFIQSVSPQDYTFMQSITILIIVVLGGIGSISGTVVTAIVLGVLDVILQNFGSLRMVIYALVLIIVMIFRPKGLLGTSEFSLKKILFDSGGDHGNNNSKNQ